MNGDDALNGSQVVMVIFSNRRQRIPASRIFSNACVLRSPFHIVSILQEDISASYYVLSSSCEAFGLGLRSGYHGHRYCHVYPRFLWNFVWNFLVYSISLADAKCGISLLPLLHVNAYTSACLFETSEMILVINYFPADARNTILLLLNC